VLAGRRCKKKAKRMLRGEVYAVTGRHRGNRQASAAGHPAVEFVHNARARGKGLLPALVAELVQ
jgi:hypothetical protein